MEGRRPRREARDSPEGALSHCVSLRASDSEVAQVSAGRSRQKESLAASPRAPGGLGCPVAHPEGRGAIEEEHDKDLVEKLKGELPGILNWALEGCAAWQAQGLNPPLLVTEATRNYRE